MSHQTNTTDAAFPQLNAIADKLVRLREVDQPRYRRLWAYCRNPMRVVGRTGGDQDRPYRQAQEWGLPSRITGAACGVDVLSAEPVGGIARKEVVIENDIGWRIDTMVNILADLGKPKKQRTREQKRRKRRPTPYRLKPLKKLRRVRLT